MENLQEAMRLIEDGISAYKASQLTGVPQSTIKDRRAGKVSQDLFCTGHPTIFSKDQELKLKDHILNMTYMGYGYSRVELIVIASDMAHFLKLLPPSDRLSESWLYAGFLKRHKEITFVKPRSLNISQAKSVSEENVATYFDNLHDILLKYDLLSSPHLIYNIDESGFSPEHTPPKLATKKGFTPQAVTSPRTTMITCIGACNAIGNSIPPFLVHKGKHLTEDLTVGASAGCGFTITESGGSNSQVFQTYLKDHFMKFAVRNDDKHILILYDGSSTHISVELIEWSLSKKIVLFVLPPHSSHLLQPLDVGCFSPLKKAFNSIAHKYLKQHAGQVLNRYNMPNMICRAYNIAMTPTNIQHSFKKTGIFKISISYRICNNNIQNIIYTLQDEMNGKSITIKEKYIITEKL